MTTDERIETLIDEIGLARLLAAIAKICEAKAYHIQTSWQDSDLADDWYLAARDINKLVRRFPM